jgi:hypothetical protein
MSVSDTDVGLCNLPSKMTDSTVHCNPSEVNERGRETKNALPRSLMNKAGGTQLWGKSVSGVYCWWAVTNVEWTNESIDSQCKRQRQANVEQHKGPEACAKLHHTEGREGCTVRGPLPMWNGQLKRTTHSVSDNEKRATVACALRRRSQGAAPHRRKETGE